MKNIFYLFVVAFFSSVVVSCTSTNEATQQIETKKKMNILFIAVDDLRPELGCYGSPIAITPNMDKLASEGLLFNNAYCQEAICSPSRASLMTGARPETINVIENYTYFRDLNPDILTLPQHLIANGYEATTIGKIYHGKYNDMDKSWNRPPAKINTPKPKRPGSYALVENQELFKKNTKEMRAKYGQQDGLGKGPAWEKADVPDYTYEDGYNADVAVATIKELAQNPNQPFFLGVGFKQPHLDWLAPKKYWDLYNPEDIPLATQTKGPENGAAMGLHASFELRTRSNIPNSGELSPELSRTAKHAYLASVSYIDAQIGKVMAELEAQGLRENTIIMLWSDHGWHLGDMGIWGKATNYEIATRVVMMASTPNMPKENRGKKTNALVELVDMYPTLCDLVGVPEPKHLEGHSYAPLLENPNKEWKQAAFSQYPNPALREWAANPLNQGMRETYFGPLIEEVEERIIAQQGDTWEREFFENDLMGYSMRTQNHRLVIWKDRKNPEKAPIYVELFDHKTDPTETKNIAEEQPALVKELLAQFDKGWKGNLPK